MLTKRRLTAQPVDSACFGDDLVVSFRNGADHVRPTPVPTEDPPEPLDSRVMAHAYGGAQSVDGWVSERQEYIRAVGVGRDGVVVCRVSELPSSNQFCAPPPPGSPRAEEKKEKVVFFSGRHRLTEMLCAAVDESALSGKGHLPRLEWSARYPTLCLHSPQNSHMAVFARDANSVTACVSRGDGWCGNEDGVVASDKSLEQQRGGGQRFVSVRHRERQIQFTGRTIACMGTGRPASFAAGHGCSDRQVSGEVTILLDDHTIAVYGFPLAAGSEATNDGRAGLGADGFPTFEALLTCAFPASKLPTSASPVRVGWAGRRTLWIVYEDGTVCALHTTSTAATPSRSKRSESRRQTPAKDRQHNEEGGEDGVATAATTQTSASTRTDEEEASGNGEINFEIAFIGALTGEKGVSLTHLSIQPDTRSSALHYCFGLDTKDVSTAITLYYGTVRLPPATAWDEKKGGEAMEAQCIRARQHTVRFSERVYGIRFDCGRYHLLTQSSQGEGPLCITSLPRIPPPCLVQTSGGTSSTPKEHPQQAIPLSLRIVYEPEETLGAHCRQVEKDIRRINDRSGGGASDTLLLHCEADVMQALLVLQELKQCVYALLCREQQQQQEQRQDSGEAGISGIRRSYPQHLLQQLTRKYTEVSAYLLLAQIGCLDGAVEQPLRDALDLQACRDRTSASQETLKQYISTTTFPVSTEPDVVHAKLWPTKVTLCIDTILADLGFSSASSLAQVLAEATATALGGSLPPVLALLVLYYSYRSGFPVVRAGETGAPAVEPPSREEQQRANETRQHFLTQCNLPAMSLNSWAFASYAVDHGIDPTTRLEDAEGSRETERPFAYVLGATVGHLDSPPLLALLPTLVNGLMDVLAFDTAHRLMGTTLAIYGAGEELPPALGLKLLFIALQTGADRDLETIFARSRGTVLEAVAAQALALAALRSGEMAPVRGLVPLGSAQERVVEATLHSCEDVARRERVLLRFYTLTQRYADALAVCEAMASRGGAEGQRASTVASHLRSLLPNGSAVVKDKHRPLRLLAAVGETGGSAAGQTAAGCCWASVAPTPLEDSAAEADQQLQRAVERPSGPHRPSATGTAAMRLSTLLNSRDRPSSTTSTTTTTAALPGGRPFSGNGSHRQKATPPPSEKDGGGVSSAGGQGHSTLGGGRLLLSAESGRESSSSLLLPAANSNSGNNNNSTCEAILQRSGKVCGRCRPCPYHDRK